MARTCGTTSDEKEIQEGEYMKPLMSFPKVRPFTSCNEYSGAPLPHKSFVRYIHHIRKRVFVTYALSIMSLKIREGKHG